MSERAQLLLEIADDELILGWRDSEWTGIAPFLEEDVAFSSIAQNEVGHARALYELAARDLGTTADELAFDRDARRSTAAPGSSSCGCPSGSARSRGTCSTRQADAMRLERLKASDDSEVAGLAAKIDREEVYHRLHAQMWYERLAGTTALHRGPRRAPAARRRDPRPGTAGRALAGARRTLWEEMTMVRRSQPAGTSW